jgi:hypothetical protein
MLWEVFVTRFEEAFGQYRRDEPVYFTRGVAWAKRGDSWSAIDRRGHAVEGIAPAAANPMGARGLVRMQSRALASAREINIAFLKTGHWLRGMGHDRATSVQSGIPG